VFWKSIADPSTAGAPLKLVLPKGMGVVGASIVFSPKKRMLSYGSPRKSLSGVVGALPMSLNALEKPILARQRWPRS
jgi:hypothetical protein